MKKGLQAFIVTLGICVATNAYAIVEENKTPTNAGVRIPNTAAYFSVKEGLTTVCTDNVVWITFDPEGRGKAAYATVLAAQLSQKKLSLFKYVLNSNGSCTLIEVSMGE